MSKIKAELTNEDIGRYIDWCRQYGVTEAQIMQKLVLKNKAKFNKLKKNLDQQREDFKENEL